MRQESPRFNADAGQIDGLVQDYSNPIANTLELLQFYIKPPKCGITSGTGFRNRSGDPPFKGVSVTGGRKSPQCWPCHYYDVIMGAMASQITSPTIVYSIVHIQVHIEENIKAPRHWPLWGTHQ